MDKLIMFKTSNTDRILLIKDLIKFNNNQTKNKINLQWLHKILITIQDKISIILQATS